MEANTEGNLLEIMDLARTLRQEQLFIQQEQAAFTKLTETLAENSTSITKLAYICAQQRQNLNNLITSRPETGPIICCRRASTYENAKFLDAKKAFDYEHAIAYEEFFNYLYRSPYLLALSLATGDRLPEITTQHLVSVIHTISTGIYGNAINSKDVEMLLNLLRELIEIQVVVNDNPRDLLRANTSAFARLYHRLNESMFSAKIFLTAALYEPIMRVLSDSEAMLDVDPNKVLQSFSHKERLRRFGASTAPEYNDNIAKFHMNTIDKLFSLTKCFIDSLQYNWSLFPSTLRWLVQIMCHQLKQAHFSEKIVYEIITDMVFTHFICPAIVSPDISGIIDATISEAVRFNLIQIGQIIQMLALTKHDTVDTKFANLHAKFEANDVTKLIDMLLLSPTGEDVVAVLSQQSDFERMHILSTQNELIKIVEFFRILLAHENYNISAEDRQKLMKIITHLPETQEVCQKLLAQPETAGNGSMESPHTKERSKLLNLGKATKSKIVKTMSFNHTHFNGTGANGAADVDNAAQLLNSMSNLQLTTDAGSNTPSNTSSAQASPTRHAHANDTAEPECILLFSIFNGDEPKLQPLTEEEVLKMNSIGPDIANGNDLLAEDVVNLENTIDKSSVTNGYDAMSDEVLRPLHAKNTHHARFSLSHDDASIGNSDNLEVVSEAPSNHSVTSSLELEENQLDQNDNLSDMVSANVSGRGTPNISGRDTPSSQVTDGEVLPAPQMQKLISKARSDIEDKFCKFELKKFEGDETVSIISDTWSTDVLASDSETVDASERERDRDRNFSTPLIPSAVVLPGDNNFDPIRYNDASDQRSESNWSTDVLASDTEKLAEIDTDDNLSITAKSDITENATVDAVLDAPHYNVGSLTRQQRGHHQLPMSSNRNIRTVNSSNRINSTMPVNNRGNNEIRSGEISSGSSGGNASDRSQEDSAFYDAINLYEEATAGVVGVAIPVGTASASTYEELSSLARSSARTSNQLSGENSFQQNYKSSSNQSVSKESFLESAEQRMRRQTSAESSISNQSLNLDEAATLGKIQHKTVLKKNRQFLQKSNGERNENKDLIDFSDFMDDANNSTELCNNAEMLLDIFTEDNVEHRRISFEQRTAVFDGRRNGMMAVRQSGGSADAAAASRAMRRHQSLNYENHEIIVKNVAAARRVTAMPNLKSSTTDDEKRQQQQQQLEIKLKGITKAEDLEYVEPFNTGIMSSPKAPTKSTGAIPKSISFDASADKISANCSTSSSFNARALPQRGARMSAVLSAENGAQSGILYKFKTVLKLRGKTKPLQQRQMLDDFEGGTTTMRSVSFNTADNTLDMLSGGRDISDDILAKYRRKASSSSETTNSDSLNGLASGVQRQDVDINVNSSDLSSNALQNNHDKAINFNKIKKKVRTVLSKTDLHTGDFRHTTCSNASPLLTYLQIQQAQAINVQNFQQISYIAEAIRCITSLEINQHTQLLTELQHDILKRQSYLQYLMRFRQNLLLVMENIAQFETRLRSESNNCNRHLITVCVRLFLEKRQSKLQTFQQEFVRVTVSDDKIAAIEEFIDSLMAELLANGSLLHGMPDWQVQEARVAIERILLQRMYQQVMFPNEDADLSRDNVLSEHICKLQRVICPSHAAICIRPEFLSEAPWTFAQQQLTYIAAYKTPREKLQCIIRCTSSIMSLLHMSSGRVLAADDLLPVLIYVIILANPPYLLSTVEYITCFIGDKMDGEEQFHWTLFGSAVTFIKTMDYLE